MAIEDFWPCPNCKTLTWALIPDPKIPANHLLHCNECGFEVDMRVVSRVQWILRDTADDRSVQADESAGP
jgi:hypothetical protein